MRELRAGERGHRFWGSLEVAIVGCVLFGCGESSRTGDTPGSGGASTHEDCSGQAQCPDNSDEVSCFDEIGHDQLVCNGAIEFAQNFCFLKCAFGAESVTCLADRTDVIVCRDGTELDIGVLCDRKDDCSEGEDEALCFR